MAPDFTDILIWSVVFLVVAGVLIAILVICRRAFLGGSDGSTGVWDLNRLTQLRSSGALSEEEYRKLRAEVARQFGSEVASGKQE